MIDRHAALARETGSSAGGPAAPSAGGPAAPSAGVAGGVAFAVMLVLILGLATWFLVGGMARPSITVNDHTDNAVPTVDLSAPAGPVTA